MQADEIRAEQQNPSASLDNLKPLEAGIWENAIQQADFRERIEPLLQKLEQAQFQKDFDLFLDKLERVVIAVEKLAAVLSQEGR